MINMNKQPNKGDLKISALNWLCVYCESTKMWIPLMKIVDESAIKNYQKIRK